MSLFRKSEAKKERDLHAASLRAAQEAEFDELRKVFNRLSELNPQWQCNYDSISCALPNGYLASITFETGDGGNYTVSVTTPERKTVYWRRFADDWKYRTGGTSVNPRAFELISKYFWPIVSPYRKQVLADNDSAQREKDKREKAIVDKFWDR